MALIGTITSFYCSTPSCGAHFTKYVRVADLRAGVLPPCKECGGPSARQRLRSNRGAGVRSSERAVIYRDPSNPSRWTANHDLSRPTRVPESWERVEFSSLHDLERFCTSVGATNDKLGYDNVDLALDDHPREYDEDPDVVNGAIEDVYGPDSAPLVSEDEIPYEEVIDRLDD